MKVRVSGRVRVRVRVRVTVGVGVGLGLGLAKVPSVTLWPSMIACARQHSWPARSLVRVRVREVRVRVRVRVS